MEKYGCVCEWCGHKLLEWPVEDLPWRVPAEMVEQLDGTFIYACRKEKCRRETRFTFDGKNLQAIAEWKKSPPSS